MKRPKVKITVIKEDTGYSANTVVSGYFIATEAETFEELKANVLEAVNLAFEGSNHTYSIDEIQFDKKEPFSPKRTVPSTPTCQRPQDLSAFNA